MPTYKPLAETLRPTILADFVGQRHLLDGDKPIGKILADGKLHSMILWGPPGSGKTTLARIVCNQTSAHFEQLSAVLDGIKELRNVLDHAQRYQQHNKSTVLFVDEIDRFNKAQQDAFLPHIESGLVTLIGATTENPSFEINSSLLSRLQVYVLKKLNDDELSIVAKRALESQSVKLEDDGSFSHIIAAGGGDARRVINIIEQLSKDSDKASIRMMSQKRFKKKLALLTRGVIFFINSCPPFINLFVAPHQMELFIGWRGCVFQVVIPR